MVVDFFACLTHQLLSLPVALLCSRVRVPQVFKQWTDGFMPPAINLPFFPFGRGMAARWAAPGWKHMYCMMVHMSFLARGDRLVRLERDGCGAASCSSKHFARRVCRCGSRAVCTPSAGITLAVFSLL